TGLDKAAIAGLPVVIVGERYGAVRECSVCLSNLEDGEFVRILPNCKHIFHVDCVDRWLESNSTCPVCRTPVLPPPKIVAEPREGIV
ncbi:hypothetical protein M569_12708, partial [Genlisea aurea]